MAKNKTTQTNTGTEMSKSKAKREERRKQVQKAKRDARAARIVGTAVALVVGVAIVAAVGRQLYILAIRTTPGTEYSAGLTADGRIENADMKTALTLADYKNISVPEDEVAATQEEVEEEINSMLESYKELKTDADLTIADGDEVNIDYVGTVDGVEFEGGNSGGAGYDVTIGSGSLVDDFEQQLIGHKPGEELTVEVTFPEDYNEEMAGKDASFAVTVNGINKTPELTDDFVAGGGKMSWWLECLPQEPGDQVQSCKGGRRFPERASAGLSDRLCGGEFHGEYLPVKVYQGNQIHFKIWR